MTTQTDMIVNKNKVLILGGTSGMGLEVARTFSKDHKVFIVGRDIQKIEKDTVLNESTKFSFDIGDEDQRQELLEMIKNEGINKIVHCAGIFKTDKQYEQKYEEEYKKVKLGGVEIIKSMISQNPKEITHVCAISSLYTLLPDSFILVPKFEKRIQKELEKEIMSLDGVTANCVAPGLTRTPLAEQAFGGEEGMKKILESAPGSRIVEPKEVAEEIYMLSNQNDINKKVIPVDGDYLKFFKFKELNENNQFGRIKLK